MPSHILHYTNTRSPSLLDTITSDGVAVDLTGTTVKLQMRAVGTSTLKIDAAASIVGSPTLGNVRYDWAAADVNTSGSSRPGGESRWLAERPRTRRSSWSRSETMPS